MILQANAATDVGLRRRVNEDRYALVPDLGVSTWSPTAWAGIAPASWPQPARGRDRGADGSGP